MDLKFKTAFSMPIDVLNDVIKEPALSYYNNLKNGVNDDLEETKYFLLCLDRLYQEGYISPLRDEEYDECLEIFLDNGGSMIRGDMSSGNKATHHYPSLKGTIKKVHWIKEEDRIKANDKNHKSFENWFMKVLDDQGINCAHVCIYPKYDGLSIVLAIDNGKVISAITRGDRDLGMGQNKTSAFEKISFKPLSNALGIKKYGLKCEVIMDKETFKSYNKHLEKPLVDSRSAAASILNKDNPSIDEMSLLKIVPLMIEVKGIDYPLPIISAYQKGLPFDPRAFDLLNDDIRSFGPYPLKRNGKGMNDFKTIIHTMTKSCQISNNPYDGIVIRIMDKDIRNKLGRNQKDCVNNWERAYKFPPETKKSKIIDIVQEIGLLGKVSFIAKIEPIKMKNKIIKSISLGSLAKFKELNLARGDEVEIRYDIIPYLSKGSDCKASGEKPIELIKECPYCHSALVMDPELSCGNPNCQSRMIGKIYNYCKKMAIEGVGEETISALFNAGLIRKISDIYELESKKQELLTIERFGKKSIENLLKAIKKVDTVTASHLLGSLGIPSCGRRIFETLLENISLDELLSFQSIKDFPEIKGFQEKTFSRILNGIKDNREEIDNLMKILVIKQPSNSSELVCFSMIRDKELEDVLSQKGIPFTYSLNKKVSLLIVPDTNASSTKIEKAKKWGIPIMGIDEARNVYGGK